MAQGFAGFVNWVTSGNPYGRRARANLWHLWGWKIANVTRGEQTGGRPLRTALRHLSGEKCVFVELSILGSFRVTMVTP